MWGTYINNFPQLMNRSKMISEQELEKRLRKIGRQYPEVNTEIQHNIEDMDYTASYTLTELLNEIGTRRDQLFDPRSSEAKEIRRLAIDIGVYEKGEVDYSSTGKKYAFKLDGQKYRNRKRVEEVVS